MSWKQVYTQDGLWLFYQSILTEVRKAARLNGYALGIHGSMRRDFDLIAVPWIEDHSTPDELAEAIQLAACGIKQTSYQWEIKPCGRIATAFPVCWSDYRAVSAGHIDLSVVDLDSC